MCLVAFMPFGTMESFADNSPPGAEISIDYEVPEGVNLNVEILPSQVWQAISLKTEGRIAVYDCDLEMWPGLNEDSNYNSNNIARVNSVYDDVLKRANMFEPSLYTKNPYEISTSTSDQYRLSATCNATEVLSIYGK